MSLSCSRFPEGFPFDVDGAGPLGLVETAAAALAEEGAAWPTAGAPGTALRPHPSVAGERDRSGRALVPVWDGCERPRPLPKVTGAGSAEDVVVPRSRGSREPRRLPRRVFLDSGSVEAPGRGCLADGHGRELAATAAAEAAAAATTAGGGAGRIDDALGCSAVAAGAATARAETAGGVGTTVGVVVATAADTGGGDSSEEPGVGVATGAGATAGTIGGARKSEGAAARVTAGAVVATGADGGAGSTDGAADGALNVGGPTAGAVSRDTGQSRSYASTNGPRRPRHRSFSRRSRRRCRRRRDVRHGRHDDRRGNRGRSHGLNNGLNNRACLGSRSNRDGLRRRRCMGRLLDDLVRRRRRRRSR